MQRQRDFGYFDANAGAYADLKFRRRRQTLQSVDAGVAALFRALEAAGAEGNTYVAYTTDNGACRASAALSFIQDDVTTTTYHHLPRFRLRSPLARSSGRAVGARGPRARG
jgi:arylsulfatase A-like enzyme